MPRAQAAREWAAVAHAWATAHLPDEIDWPTVAALLGRVVAAAPVAGAPLFAGWRALDEPEDAEGARVAPPERAARAAGRAARRRGAHRRAHAGRGDRRAHARRCCRSFGWPEPHPEPKPLHDRWGLAEARTDRMFGRHLAVLDDDERAELVALLAPLAEPAARHDLAARGSRGRDAARPRVRTAPERVRDASASCSTRCPTAASTTSTLDACRRPHRRLLRFEPDPTDRARRSTEAQRAAVGYAEQYALDPHGLRDSDFDALHAYFTDAQLATLTLAVAMYDALRALLRRAGGLMARVRSPKGGLTPFDHQPRLWEAFNRYYGTLWSDGVVDDPTKEVGRLRNARVTGCGICKNLRFATAREQGLEEEYVELIDDAYADSDAAAIAGSSRPGSPTR